MSGVVDALYDGVLVVDRDRVIRDANAAAARLLRRPRSELIGSRCDDVLDWGSRDWPPAAYLRSTRAISPQDVTARGRPQEALVVAGTYVRGSDGTLDGAVLSLRGGRRAAKTGPSGIEIVSTVSHELRSPLTSVKGFTSLMLNRWERLADDQKKMMLEQVNHDADRVTRLITELLDISRLETGRLVLRRQMVDLARLTASVAEKVRLEYPELDATIEFPDDFPKVYADPDKIEQVLTNLVENACKYASPEGIRIVGTVEGEPGAGSVGVEVQDRGEGIPVGDLPKVFTKFFRREVGRPTGSGLGLWISRGLVESHGGQLTATSREGEGSAFCFRLPLIDLDQLQAP